MHRFGFYGSLLDPLPGLIGISLGANLAHFIRFNVSYGGYSSGFDGIQLTTVSAGATIFFLQKKFTPCLGLQIAKVKFERIEGLTRQNSAFGVSGDTEHAFISPGFDLQANNGFMLAFGFNKSLRDGIESYPYFRLGWFF